MWIGPSVEAVWGPPSHRIAGILYRTLESVLTRRCARRYRTGVLFRCTEFRSGQEISRPQDDDASEMHIQVECRGLTRIALRLRVRALGDTNYEIRCALEGDTVHRLVYRWPGQANRALRRTSHLAQDLARSLFDEVDQRVGRHLPSGVWERGGSEGPMLS